MAEQGLVGPERVVQGEFGYFKAYHDNKYRAEGLARGLGAEWQLAGISITHHSSHLVVDTVYPDRDPRGGPGRIPRLGRMEWMSETTADAPARAQIVQLLRALCHLIALIAITWWALAEWPMPWPGLLAGAGFFVLTVLVWALFLSPRPVLHTDRFGRSFIELLLIAGALGALLGLGLAWPIPVLFGIVAAVLGFVAGS